MHIALPAHLCEFVQTSVARGKYASFDEMVAVALDLLRMDQMPDGHLERSIASALREASERALLSAPDSDSGKGEVPATFVAPAPPPCCEERALAHAAGRA